MNKTTLKPETVRLLRRVQRYIRQEPKRFIMSRWGVVFDPTNYDSVREYRSHMEGSPDLVNLPSCGTAACIAGTVILLTTEKKKLERFLRQRVKNPWGNAFLTDLVNGNIVLVAARRLGIPPDKTNRLFHLEEWPEPFESAFSKARTARKRAEVGVARINHFIATGGAE